MDCRKCGLISELEISSVFLKHVIISIFVVLPSYGDDEDEPDETNVGRVLKKCLNKAINRLTVAEEKEIQSIFDELNEIYPSEKTWLEAFKYWFMAKAVGTGDIYENEILGLVSTDEQALKIFENSLPDEELDFANDIIQIHCSIGDVYSFYRCYYSMANSHFDQAISSYISSLDKTTDTERRINLYQIIYEIYAKKTPISLDKNEKRDNILNNIKYRESCLEEVSEYYPSEHQQIASCLHQLAQLQQSIFLFEEALASYQRTIEIRLQQDQPEFNKIADIYRLIYDLYIEQKQDYTSALRYGTMELEYWIKHDDIVKLEVQEEEKEEHYFGDKTAECHERLADMHIKLGQLQLARKNLERAKQLYTDGHYACKNQCIKQIEEKLIKIN